MWRYVIVTFSGTMAHLRTPVDNGMRLDAAGEQKGTANYRNHHLLLNEG